MARTRKKDVGFGSLFEEDYLVRVLGCIVHDPDIALTERVANARDTGELLLDLTISAVREEGARRQGRWLRKEFGSIQWTLNVIGLQSVKTSKRER